MRVRDPVSREDESSRSEGDLKVPLHRLGVNEYTLAMLKQRTVALVSGLILCALVGAGVAQSGPRPWDEKAEVAASRKVIEGKYEILSDAIFNGDADKADPVLDEYFELFDTFTRPLDELSDDEGDYLNDIEENTAVMSVQKKAEADLGTKLKVERKLTNFVAGRRLAMAVYTETSTGEIVDTEGQFGPKGKKAKLELRGVFHDQWRFDESNDKDGADWYLYAREATSFSFKINGKPVPIETSGD